MSGLIDITVDLIGDLENYLPLEESFVVFTTKNLLNNQEIDSYMKSLLIVRH